MSKQAAINIVKQTKEEDYNYYCDMENSHPSMAEQAEIITRMKLEDYFLAKLMEIPGDDRDILEEDLEKLGFKKGKSATYSKFDGQWTIIIEECTSLYISDGGGHLNFSPKSLTALNHILNSL